MTDMKKPLGGSALAGDSQKGYSEISSFSDRIERYGKAKSRQLRIVNHLKHNANPKAECLIDSEKLSNKLCSCGNYLVFNQYYTVGQTRLKKASFCKNHLLCQLCAIRRGAKQVEAYSSRYELLNKAQPHLKPYLLTLTVKNGNDLQERFRHLTVSFRKYLERRRNSFKRNRGFNELSKAEGGVFSYEVTKSSDGSWHPHLHMVVLLNPDNLIDFPTQPKKHNPQEWASLSPAEKRNEKLKWQKYISSKSNTKLSIEWLDITGDSSIVDLRPIEGDPVEGFVEVFKYALKFSDMKPEDNIYAYSVLKGSRLTGSFGSLWGVKVPDKLEDDLLSDLPYIELFYAYTKSGYSLQTATPFDSDTALDTGPLSIDDCEYVGTKKDIKKELDTFRVPKEELSILDIRDRHSLGTHSWYELNYYHRLKVAKDFRARSRAEPERSDEH
jgi:plasmid rolling circle replication initiator protein Rep